MKYIILAIITLLTVTAALMIFNNDLNIKIRTFLLAKDIERVERKVHGNK